MDKTRLPRGRGVELDPERHHPATTGVRPSSSSICIKHHRTIEFPERIRSQPPFSADIPLRTQSTTRSTTSRHFIEPLQSHLQRSLPCPLFQDKTARPRPLHHHKLSMTRTRTFSLLVWDFLVRYVLSIQQPWVCHGLGLLVGRLC